MPSEKNIEVLEAEQLAAVVELVGVVKLVHHILDAPGWVPFFVVVGHPKKIQI